MNEVRKRWRYLAVESTCEDVVEGDIDDDDEDEDDVDDDDDDGYVYRRRWGLQSQCPTLMISQDDAVDKC